MRLERLPLWSGFPCGAASLVERRGAGQYDGSSFEDFDFEFLWRRYVHGLFSEEEDSVFCKLCGGLLRKGAQHG